MAASFWCGLLLSAVGQAEEAVVPRFTADTKAEFATVEQSQAILKTNDAFVTSLSRFDLQCRMKTDKEVSIDEWKAFAAGHVKAWEAKDRELVEAALAKLAQRLASFRLPLPPRVQLVR